MAFFQRSDLSLKKNPGESLVTTRRRGRSRKNLIGELTVKMIKRLLPALAALLSIGAAADSVIPPFTPFDLTASSTGYIVQGQIYAGNLITNGTMVIDTPNNRVAFLFGPVGTFITTPTDSINFNIPQFPGQCLVYSGFGYSSLVSSFTKLTSSPMSTKKYATYQGLTKDSFSCNQNIAFALTQELVGGAKTPVITEMFAALPSVFGSLCLQGQAYFLANTKTLDTTSNRDAYFALPPSCSTPIDYCSHAYPPGNSCAIDCP